MPFAAPGHDGRRQRHDSRPEEPRAINALDAAVAKGALRRQQDLIATLGTARAEKCLEFFESNFGPISGRAGPSV
jgi:hypothetical protein